MARNDSLATLIDGISSDDDADDSNDNIAEHSCSKSTIINGDSDSDPGSDSGDTGGSKLVGFSFMDVFNKVSARVNSTLVEGGANLLEESVESDKVDTENTQNDFETRDSFHLHFSPSESEAESGDASENHVASFKLVQQKLLMNFATNQEKEKLQMDDSVLKRVEDLENMENITMTNGIECDLGNGCKNAKLDYYEDNFHLYFSGSESELDSGSEGEICSSTGINVKRTSTFISRKRKLQFDDSTNAIIKLAEKCCEANKCMDSVNESDFVYCQRQMKDKNESGQKQFILSEIGKHTKTVTSNNNISYEHNFIISGNIVCPKAWCIAHGVSDWRFQQCLKLFKSGVVNIQHGNKGHQRKRCKTVLALAWMKNLFKTIGDYMPHKPVVHLPHDWTKRSVYDRMVKELGERGDITDNISYSHFTRIWVRYLGKFIIPNVSIEYIQ